MMSIKTFNYQGISIYYAEQGVGKTILFIHGLASASYSWRHVIGDLSSMYRTIAIDLKGAGLSDKPSDKRYSLQDQVDMVIRFIMDKDLNNITLVGHSYGGAVSLMVYQQLSAESPLQKVVNRIILLDPMAYKDKIPFVINLLRIPKLNYLMLNCLLPLGRLPFLVRLGSGKVFYDKSKVTDEMIDVYMGFMKQAGGVSALTTTIEQIFTDDTEDFHRLLKDIRIPVLIIWGREDPIIPLSVGERFKEDISHAEWLIIPECGHNPHEEKPSEVIQSIKQFIVRTETLNEKE
ncbi:MAG: alpha/beta hydrolase [bacterium]|nr:MAG: alpha/beta hydrolase [bacterium]